MSFLSVISQVTVQRISHIKHIENLPLPADINSSLDSYLANIQMARNGVWGTDIDILSAASLLILFIHILFTPNLGLHTKGS